MKTEVVIVDLHRPDAAVIARAADILRGGGLVAFPTETVYGLGADALNPAAVARIFEAKGRPANNPLIVHVADLAAARRLAAEWPASAERLAADLWPGPLTLVLRRNDAVPPIVTAGGATVAIRMPAHPVARALIAAAGCPVAAPSANRSSRLSPTRAQHVIEALDGRIEMILDAGPAPDGLESTVLDLSASPPRILRPGPVTPERIETTIGAVLRPCAANFERATRAPMKGATPPRSPGMLARHYAPRARLECVRGDASARVRNLRDEGERVGWVRYGQAAAFEQTEALTVTMPCEPEGYGARLYAVLHDLDRAGADRIVVELPPDHEAWQAIRDRLARAAAPAEEERTAGT